LGDSIEHRRQLDGARCPGSASGASCGELDPERLRGLPPDDPVDGESLARLEAADGVAGLTGMPSFC
jgi:hypothetical protein